MNSTISFTCPADKKLIFMECFKKRSSLILPVGSIAFSYGNGFHYRPCLFQASQPFFVKTSKSVWSLRSSVNGNPTNSNSGTTRLIKFIQNLQIKLNAGIQKLRKNLPLKFLFFLIGFYSATAFSTVIGQTGDWDILSAALAVVVVEGIGALMYRTSAPFFNRIRSLIIMFNYWKAGLSLGLFLDSFKYELWNIFCTPFKTVGYYLCFSIFGFSDLCTLFQVLKMPTLLFRSSRQPSAATGMLLWVF